jgi:hypothetical protein
MDLPRHSTGQAARRFGALREKHALSILCVAIVAALVWLPRLSDVLFVDEAGTFWLIEDGPLEGLRRALAKTGQSWLYAIGLSLWSLLFGTSEIALRLPSTLAALGTCMLVIRIARERNVVWPTLAGLLLALTPSMTFAATIARPYALGLFFSTLAISLLQSWIRQGHKARLYGSVAATLCALYCHYTFIALLFPLLVVLAENREYKRDPGSLLNASILLLLGLSPYALTLARISDDEVSAVAIVDKLPSIQTQCLHFFSATLALVVTLILCLKMTIFRRSPITKVASSSDDRQTGARFLGVPWLELRFGLALYLAPKLVTLVAALTINPTLLIPRYSILSLVGEAYTASVLLATVSSRFWMVCLGGVTIGSMLLPHFMATPPDTAWRPIIERSRTIASRDSCTFFALVGFAESKHAGLLTREPTYSFIISPLTYYDLEPAVLLPASVDFPIEQDYMTKMVYPKIPPTGCSIVLEWQIVDSSPSTMSGPQALARELSLRGCTNAPALSAGLVTLTHWRCD